MIFLLLTAGPCQADGWSYSAWTSDATSGIDNSSTYTAAHCFGNNHASVTVNGVVFTEDFNASGTGWTSSGTQTNWNGDDNAALTGSSEDLGEEFIYSGNPRTVTFTGLTSGVSYVASFYSVAWEASGREQTFAASGGTSLVLDQDLYGNNNGILISYAYTASGTSQQFTITPSTAATFHMYALSNRTAVAADPLTLADHAEGQKPDRLNGDVNQTGVEVFAFQLANATGSTVTQNGFAFQLSALNGMLQGDFDNFYLYVDADGSGDLESGETDVGDRVCVTEATTAISGSTGTITFSGCGYDVTNGTTVKMILTGDLSNLAPGDSFTVDLGTDDLTPAAVGSDSTPTTHWVDGSNEYHFRRKITIDKDELGTCSSDLTDFPLLVTLTGSDFSQVALAVGATGDDIIFKDADGNQLDHEIEEFDKTTNNRLVAWVRVPTIYYDGDTVIWMYYGNSSVTAPTENAAGVWDGNFKGVWHMTEVSAADSTQYDNDGTQYNGVTNTASGRIGPANIFADGDQADGDYIDLGNDSSLQITGELSISAWVAIAGSDGEYLGIAGKLDDTGDNGYALVRHSDNKFKLWVGNGVMGSADSNSAYTDTNWHHVVGVVDNGTNYLYVDGALQTDTDSTVLVDSGIAAHIGRQYYNWNRRFWQGNIDEVRLSNSARDACWIGTEYSNQKSDSILYTLGSQENLNYNFRKKITIDYSSVIGADCAADLTDFPYLVTMTGSDFAQVADNVDSDGYDIIFKDVNGNRLDHEIEEYDEATANRLNAWVRIPTLYYDRDTVIYLYYGNPAVTAATENPAGVWDSNFAGVWHLNEDVDDEQTSGTHIDSTGNNNGSQNGNVEGTGKMADGQDFDGQTAANGDYINAGTSPGSATDLTIAFWMKADVNATHMRALGKLALDGTSDQGWSFLVRPSGESGYDRALIFRIGEETNYGGWGNEITAEQLYDVDQWVHVVGTFAYNGSNGGTGRLYADGAEVDSVSNTDGRGVANTVTPFLIGWNSSSAGTGSEDFNGMIDEVRISDIARDLCWIQTEHTNQSAPAGSYTVGLEEGLNYLYRKKITVNASQIDGDCSSDISNFPLLVTLTGTDFTDIEDDLSANAYALNFIAEDDAVCGGAGTASCVLDHEIELYDTTNDKLVAWVRIPVLDYNDDTLIYLHYGNPNITASTENAAGVWDNNFKGVYHLDDASGNALDATANSNDGTYNKTSGTFPNPQDGAIGNGQDFEYGDAQYIVLSNESQFDFTGNMTVSAWIKVENPWDTSWQAILAKGEGTVWRLHRNSGTEFVNWVANSNTSGDDDVNDGNWHLVTAIHDGTNIKLFVDGVQDGATTAAGAIGTNDSNVMIGNNPGAATRYWDGMMDEVRLSNTARDVCWIGTEYNNQKASSTLVTVAAEERWTFDHYKTITIDKDYVGSSCSRDLADFPVMIKITGDDFTEIANDVDADGYDIIFKDANGNQLAHEIEKYDETTDNELIAWVKVPRLSAVSDTVITLHYGNDDISTATENPAAVWDSNFKGVYHLDDASGSALDATANSNDGTYNKTSGTFPNPQDGAIGKGQDFEYDNSNYIDIPNESTFDFTGNMTASLWMKVEDPWDANWQALISKGGSAWRVMRQNDTEFIGFFAGPAFATGDDDVNDGNWHYVTAVHDGTNSKLYIDGVQDGTTGSGAISTNDLNLNLGAHVANLYWDGMMDEVRISDTARDLCWIQTEYNNQNAPTTFYSISSEQVFAFTTAIDLLSFTASGQNDTVQVAWETASETGNLGFYLYRSDSAAGPFVRITDQLIAGLNDSVEGRIYTYPDTDVTNGQPYFYKLEDLDMDGRRTFHGPVGVDWDGAGAPVVAEGDPDPVPWEPGGETGPVTVSAADEPVYKIMVAEEGLYRLTRDFLAGQSVALDKVDLSRVRLYHQGREVAVWVHDENSDTVFDAADHITFYALPVAAEFAKYSADNVYWLTTGTGENPVKRMATVDSAPDSEALATGFDATVRREQDQYYYPAAPGADEFDRWFNSTWVVGDQIIWQDAGQPITFTLDTPGATGTGTLTVALLGTYNTDHQVDISVNGGPTQTFSWSGITFYEAVIEDAALVDGLNAISLTCKTGLDALLLDWLEADYPRNYAAAGDQLKLTSNSPERFVVTGFAGSELLAFDITDPENVGRGINFQTGGSGPYSLEFTPPNAAAEDRTYLVLSTAALLTPRAVTADAASNLTDAANGADYIVITHRNLGWDANGDPYAWLTDLLALRQAQGHRVTTVDLTDIYDEFAFGLATPAAIRDFLAYAAGFWTAPAPRYVLLVGDATYDYKDNWGYGSGDDVPTYTIFTRDAGETVTDEWYTAVSGGDAAPDLYIGRLPAATAAEAALMVAKIVSYETAVNTKTWQNNIVLVADNMTRAEEAVFETMNNDAANLLPAALGPPFKAYLDDYDSAGTLTADLLAQINAGSLLVNYSGHASVQIWAAERIFETGDVPGLANAGRYPVIISMSCLSGYFAYPAAFNFPSLSEALMRAADKGAVGMLVPTGQTDPTVQHSLNTALFEAIFTADIRQLGAAVGRARQIFLAGGSTTRTELSQTFALFGDPAMVLQVPLPRRPGGLSAQLTATNTVELAWNSALDSNGAAAAGYHIYRATTAGGPYTRLNGTVLTATAYSDAALTAGATYYYVVTAMDSDGDESVPGEESSVELTDSDGDGLYDLLEAAGCTAVSLPDSDGDGLADGVEDANRNGSVDAGETDPCDSDSDGDGLPDGWEAASGLDPVSDSGAAGPDGDPDADGWTNYQEYLSCTDPADAGSVPGAPTVPALNYPANGDETAARQPWLSVSNAEDADCQALRYVFEVYADAGLTTQVAATAAEGEAEDDNTTAWQVGSLLNDNTYYYWRARAHDGISYSDWMTTAGFFVNTTPDAPTVPAVSAPPDGSEVAVLQPTLEVVNAADADRDALTYEFRVYVDASLATLVSSQTDVAEGSGGTTSWQVAVPLADDTPYWWTVQATDDDGLAGGWNSAAGFFVNTENDAPTAPPGGSPADGAEVATTTPLLAVVHATDSDLDPLSYFFEIDVVDTFNSFELEQSGELAQQAGETTGWTPLELMDNTTCYWRVRAFDGMAYGPWHSGSFFVNTANDAPGVPAIDHPGDLSDVTTRQPTLAVKAAVDADLDSLAYEFELYADAGLTDLVATVDGADVTWQVDETLTDNRGYFWRARAVDAHGAAGDWSARVSFFVNTANDPPRTPVLNNPVSGGTDTSLTPTLSVFNAADLDQDALNYEFELYADADLSRLVSAATAAQGQQITSWSVSSALADGGIYYWRARAHDGQQPGSWMPTAVFEIHTAGADTRYEIQSRHEIFAGALDPQDVAVAAVDSPIFNTSVEIPPGALRDNCTILIGPVSNPPALPRNTRAIGRVTEFGPSGMTFNLPLVIKLPYTAAALRQARVADPAELQVFYYDTSILAWVPVAIAGIDSINQLVSIETGHFSMYTIGASVADAASGGSSGGCFIAAAARAEAAVFKIDWPDTSLLGLLALFGLLWLGKRGKDRR